ncbi:MAG: glycosyltransferase family 2 protein [Bacteroidetes bacterium]|nr:glycosyltransferase family 2 protein [Bacteroidota bacterium]
MTPTTAIVILNWNGRKYLEKFLPFVMASTFPGVEVIVADNNSTDDSVAFLTEHYPSIRVIRLSRNWGFAAGYNEALKLVDADYYVLLNSDVEVTPGWIEPMLSLLEGDATIGACQPKIRMYADQELFEYAGAAGGWLDYLGYPFAKGRIFDVCEKDNGQFDVAEPIFWATGAALFIRARLYHELGGLDGYFFAHQEEIDLCWRMQLAGYRVYSCPASVVFHVGGGTLPKGNERKVFLNFRNNLIMMAKNLPLGQLLWKIPFRFLLDSISAWKSLVAGEAVYFWAILEAHLAFLKWVVFKRKESVFPKSRKGVLLGWYSGSVVWQYFVKGRKTFGEIVKGGK